MTTHLERRELHYSGHVQGVGFRFRTQHLAKAHVVTGFVRNLADGRVELVVEGEPAELDLFLAAIQAELGEFIRSTQVFTTPATGEFFGFEIRY